MQSLHRLSLLILALVALVVVGEEMDYYDVLGLAEERDEASDRDIKSNWRKLSKDNHPDLHGEANRAHYQKIQRAYEVLGDRRKRKVYDLLGDDGLKQLEQPHQQQQHFDPFMQLFGGGGGGGGNKGANIHMLMLVTLSDVYNGATHTVKLAKQKICRSCRGTGAASKEDMITCPVCKGAGMTMQRIQIAPGFVQQMQQPCSHCSGKGKTIGKKCPTCKGDKVVRATMSLSVDIERGTPDQFDNVYELEADQTPGQLPGDVIFTISTAHHERFRRLGDDLAMTETITLKEALLGFERKFAHLDDHEVELSAEDGVVTQYGTVQRVEGEGMPKHHVPSEFGALLVTYQVQLPKSLTEEQIRRLDEILPPN